MALMAAVRLVIEVIIFSGIKAVVTGFMARWSFIVFYQISSPGTVSYQMSGNTHSVGLRAKLIAMLIYLFLNSLSISIRPSVHLWVIISNNIVFCFIIIVIRCLRVFQDKEFVLSFFTELFVFLSLRIYCFVIVRGDEVSETFTFVQQNRIIVRTMFVFVSTAQ